ncbi:addiction module protein [Alkalitalea saponilacus]|uniref:Putative addiction module component, TIGR02574 family n=1 Tax=Alkalitalea saponilacus TaxID=889453 RepID=A0A1T5F4K5_9BACT|nr:addiction module protein [Alkalitalea saponilacus]ASB50176.1 addiction module protein [Alkalitalea saponilacus]SKB91154.1 putative addiction module component, TIGR02574 family [Alkalitalea saponilacus]
MTKIMQDILKLSVSERILMVEAIWDSIAESDEQVELSEETKQLLEERLEGHKNNPEEGSSWDEVKARIKSQF